MKSEKSKWNARTQPRCLRRFPTREPTQSVIAQVQSGRVRAIATTGARRWPLLPQVPAFLAPLQPSMCYLLIDEGACTPETVARLPHNLVAAIFQLEQPHTLEGVQRIVAEVGVGVDERDTLGLTSIT